MKVQFNQLKPGFGELVFTRLENETFNQFEGFTLQNTQKLYLSDNGTGWQASRTVINKPFSISEDGLTLTVGLDPQEVDFLDQDTYLIVLTIAGNEVKTRVRIHSVAASPLLDSKNLNYQNREAPKIKSVVSESSIVQEVQNKTVDEQTLLNSQKQTEKKLPLKLIYAAGAAVLLVAGIAAFMTMGGSTLFEEPIPVRQQVQDFFATQQRNPEVAFNMAKKLKPATKEEQDAVYRLYYFAAQNGVKDAFIPYAKCMDPTQPEWGSIQKDPREAHDFYKRAGAQDQMRAVQSWVENQVKNGNTVNKLWLQTIQ